MRLPFAPRISALAILALPLPAAAIRITEYPLPNAASGPYTIVVAKDGRLWFTETSGNRIGAMTTGGIFTEWTVSPASSAPTGITPVADSRPDHTAVWFTSSAFGGWGGIDVVNGETSGGDASVAYLYSMSTPSQIVLGPDRRYWVTEYGSDPGSVFALDGGAGEPATRYPLPTSGQTGPLGIAAAPDGSGVWITEDLAGKIAFCNIGGVCTEYTPPTLNSHPRRIAVDRRGVVWFTENATGKIGRYDPLTGFKEFPQTGPVLSTPLGITVGPDGNVWFTEHDAGKIGRIRPSGTIDEFPLPTAGSGPTSICTGPDGNLYVTENSANKIAKIELFVPGDVDGNGSVTVADVFYLINYLFAGGAAPK